ncbi:hypothetical protein HBI68_192890 [Parastagonospora nodorum]|nr:hypothetical protein HBI68_192890 [Parastagonospora nodorum]
MANSKYEYVRLFEQPDTLLANTWIVVRIDGRGFSKLTTKYKFTKPNDRNALDLMNAAAEAVMKDLPDLVLAYGNSDEFSFVFHKDCVLFERRASKLTTTITSTFTSYYVFLWAQYFPDKPLTAPLPSFDGRAVCYPSDFNLRDYMSWRQVDCHINNLYNTTFWALVQQGGMEPRAAEQKLSGTYSADKNEILFKEFGINYNNEPECFKKGTVLYRDFFSTSADKSAVSAAQPQEQHTNMATSLPQRLSSRRAIDNTAAFLPDQTESPVADRGSTFLSPASTPSPPQSPQAMSRPTLPNPLRSNPVSERNSSNPSSTMPLSPPYSATYATNGSYITSGPAKHPPALTLLPLSPPILKPSTKPPTSLNAPNPTTRTNFSPTSPAYDFPAGYPISGYQHILSADKRRQISHSASHSASAAMTMANVSGATQTSTLKQRSPSQPHLPSYFAGSNMQQTPPIPLRMSSIPANNKPRKLSLQNQRSFCTLRGKNSIDEGYGMAGVQSAGLTTPRRVSPPLRTNKALPSPPLNRAEEMRTREKVVMATSPITPTTRCSPHGSEDFHKRAGQVWPHGEASHPGIAELPATAAKPQTHARSVSVSATLSQPFYQPDVEALSSAAIRSSAVIGADDIQPTAPLKDSPHSKGKATFDAPVERKPVAAKQAPASRQPNISTSKGRAQMTEQGGWAAGTHASTAPQSRTQRDKERKKRSKAKILIEHVDIIKDEFWEKRPWLLSGKIPQ